MTRFTEFVVRAIAAAQARRGEEGQGMAEYGLILALVAVIVAGALVTLEGGITATLNDVVGAM